MIILFYNFMTEEFLPRLGSYSIATINALMPCVIMLAGIVILLGAVGIKVSNNLGSTIVKGVFGTIGILVHFIWKGIVVLFLCIIGIIPTVYKKSQSVLSNSIGLSQNISSVLAFIVVALFVIVII